MHPELHTRAGLHLFRPPYQDLEPLDLRWQPEPVLPGGAVVWFMSPVGSVWEELAWLTARPRTFPFFVVLPQPDDVVPLAPVLRLVPDLKPKGVLPTAPSGTLTALRTLLAAPPPSLGQAVAGLLTDEGVLRDDDARDRVVRIFAHAPRLTSISKLARKMAQSRRTLGRFFSARGLPVPSHWLQFARVLHVALQLQNTRTSINRVSTRNGYPDGFTLSNAMKRLTGYRPSFVRENLGWEWLVAAWLRGEAQVGEEKGE